MSVEGWSRRKDLEEKNKVRVWQSNATDEKLLVENLTTTGQGYAVFLYEEDTYTWTKIGEFADQVEAIEYAVTRAEENT